VPDNSPSSFDEYEHQIGEALKVWSPQQRLAFVATLTERWLLVYETFSAAEGQGDAAALRQIIDAVWDHLRGRLLTPGDATRLSELINENTPDTEDFDQLPAWRALQACVLLGLALECCKTVENTATTTTAALAALEAAAGDWPDDLAGQRRVWKKSAVREEVGKQLALREAIAPIMCFDDQTIAMLRSRLGSGERPARAVRAKSPGKRKRVDDDSVEGLRLVVRRSLSRSVSHRIAFAAALAERHLPLYYSFASATGRGRPELLTSVLDAVWQAARGGQPMTSAVFQELQSKLHQGQLNAQEAEAWSAWSAWRLLELALACCGSGENSEPAEESALVAYECIAGPGSRNDSQTWKNQHRRPEIHNEVMKQMMLLMRLRAIPELDDQSLNAIRGRS
jgi:uncharacterized protein YjaG (DUF416 family)